jgi:Na+/melibiose symporter-like transporter
MSQEPARLTVSKVQVATYSVPVAATYLLLGPTYNIVPTLYAKYFGLSLGTVAAVVLWTRIIDAFADPVIGLLSDRHRMAGGSRKPWIAAGAIGLAIASYGLFNPFQTGSAIYYLVWNLSFFLAYSLLEIPHVTWGGELAREHRTRSAIFSARSAAVFTGFILWSAFPLLPLFENSEFTPDVLQVIALAGGGLVLAATVLCLAATPNGLPAITRHTTWREAANAVTDNRPLWLLLAGYLFCVLALGMWQGLAFLYLDSHLGLGAKFALMQMLSNVAGLAAIPFWKALLARADKATLWAISLAVFLACDLAFLTVDPGESWWLALALMAVIHACFSCQYMVIPALLGDIADYGELKYRQNRGATYFALWNLLSKIGFGLGGAASMAIAGVYAVDASARSQSATAVEGLHLAFVFIPAGLTLIAVCLALLSPIGRRRHAIVVRRLAARDVPAPAAMGASR